MVHSMTGFGAAAREAGGTSIRSEVRSVNHRFLQVKVRLPHDFSHLEPEIDALVKKRFQRGAITVGVNVSRNASAQAVGINGEVAQRYATALAKLAKQLGREEPGLEALLALPGVVESGEDPKALEQEAKHIHAAVDEALGAMQDMRRREGEAMQRDLLQLAGAVEKLSAKIAKRMPTVVRKHHENLVERAAKLVADKGAVVSQADLARELAVLADRMDVSEEVVRLASHLEQFQKLIGKGGAIGRQLDFLVQELLREVNTIGSKCNDATVAHWVVDAKTRIERMREQVQNVE